MEKHSSFYSLLFGFLIFLGTMPFMSPPQQEGNSAPMSLEELINLPGLRQEGPDWRVIYQDLGAGKGHFRLSQSKWLMYFLHWRPLTEANRTISIAYVRNHLLNFWGQAMNFKLMDVDGEMEICGHKAYFTEGSFGNGAVYTRFIVWNCPETNRQFTADCNINLQRKTPRELLDLQRTITQTVCCHKDAPSPEVPAELSQRYQSDKWDVSFFIPPTWRTADFVSKEWFPQGMTAQSGSLWTLLTDSLKRLELVWEPYQGALSADMFKHFMKECVGPFTFENVTSEIINWDMKSVQEKNGIWTGDGTYEYRQKVQNQEAISSFRFKGFLWKDGEIAYFLLASLIQVKEFWNIPNDLSPSDETFNRFLREQVLPNVKVIPRVASPVFEQRKIILYLERDA